MSRAWDVFFGTVLIVILWIWMLEQHDHFPITFREWFSLVGDVCLAAFITAPVYREYLK